MTVSFAVVASHPAPVAIDPPSASMACASCGARRFPAPRMSSVASISIAPAPSAGSTSPPLFTTSCAARSGKPGRSTTITRSPFASVVSTGSGSFTVRGSPGSGGFSKFSCANANAPNIISSAPNKPVILSAAEALRSAVEGPATFPRAEAGGGGK